MPYVNKIREKILCKQMQGKYLTKTQQSFMTKKKNPKKLNKLETEGNVLNLIKNNSQKNNS